MMPKNEEVMYRMDNLVAQLELEGYPFEYIMEELEDYLELVHELSK